MVDSQRLILLAEDPDEVVKKLESEARITRESEEWKPGHPILCHPYSDNLARKSISGIRLLQSECLMLGVEGRVVREKAFYPRAPGENIEKCRACAWAQRTETHVTFQSHICWQREKQSLCLTFQSRNTASVFLHLG